jgi:hypothetical protein
MSYLRYLCLFGYSGVQHIMLWLCFSSSCVPYIASYSGLSLFDCPFGILYTFSLNACRGISITGCSLNIAWICHRTLFYSN